MLIGACTHRCWHSAVSTNLLLQVTFVGDNDMMFTTGFSKMSERQYGIWKKDDLSKPAKLEMVWQL